MRSTRAIIMGAALVGSAALLTPLARAQEGGGMPQAQSPFQRFVERLGLDLRTQAPDAEKIFSDAAEAAAPIGAEMMQLRQVIVNLELGGKTAELEAATQAYSAAAAKMVGLEASAFGKVYALLRPNQQSRAAQAFEMIPGIFQPPAGGRGGARGGAGGRRGGGGQ